MTKYLVKCKKKLHYYVYCYYLRECGVQDPVPAGELTFKVTLGEYDYLHRNKHQE